MTDTPDGEKLSDQELFVFGMIDRVTAERDAAQARVKQADIEHEETVKMMRELIAERDNEIACLMALKENGQ